MNKIVIDIFDEKSIGVAIQQVKDFEKELNAKAKLFCEKLAEIGFAEAQSKIDLSPLSGYINVRIEDRSTIDEPCMYLVATGSDKGDFNTLLAVEFGAGIHYNPIANPDAEEYGFGVGTYPGQTHAFEDGWVFWNGNEWIYTHGVKAYMPMNSAKQKMLSQIEKIAKEVFK